MMTILCVFAALCLINISIISAQTISSESCAELYTPMQNFIKRRQMGLWYSHEYSIWDGTTGCYASVAVSTGSNTALVTDTYRVLSLKTDSSILGEANYTKPGVGFYTYKSGDYNSEVTILSSDYYNYSVECVCTDFDDHSESFCYVMSRTRSVRPSIQKKIDKILDDNNIDRTKMIEIKQDIKTCVLGSSKGLLQTLLSILG